MKSRNIRLRHFAATAVALISMQGACLAAGETPPGASSTADDEAALRAQAQEYATAFSSGNVSALTEMWAPDGTLIDVRGQEFRGRDEIAKDFNNFLSRFGKQHLEVKVESIRFPTSNIAIEEGTSRLIDAPTPIHATRYQVVHAKKDGKWQMVTVTETPYLPVDSADYLKELSWLVGEWKAEGPKGSMKFVANWIANKNFISCSWYGSDSDQPAQMEIIGWDPAVEQIASWHFDRSGGFGYASWTRDKNNWLVDAHAVQPGGSTGQAEYVFKKVDDNNFTWRSDRRILDGVEMPGTDEIKVSRNK